MCFAETRESLIGFSTNQRHPRASGYLLAIAHSSVKKNHLLTPTLSALTLRYQLTATSIGKEPESSNARERKISNDIEGFC